MAGTKWYETAEFLELRKKWYDKLERKGFKDVEYTDWDSGESQDFMRFGSIADLARAHKPDRQRYYELARQHLWRLRDDHKPIRIWKLHSEGVGAKRIAEVVGKPVSYVRKYIEKQKEIMLRLNSEEPDDI